MPASSQEQDQLKDKLGKEGGNDWGQSKEQATWKNKRNQETRSRNWELFWEASL